MTGTRMETIEDIIDAANASGSYWFSPNTLTGFGTVVSEQVYPMPDGSGTLFITTDDNFDRSERVHTIRIASLTDSRFTVDHIGELGEYRDLEAAHAQARRTAGTAVAVAA